MIPIFLGALLGLTTPQDPPAEPANLAIAATPSTSYVSGHETLEAVNDGLLPTRSSDNSQGAYGNWPRRGTQWLQYEWALPVHVDRVEVYWYIDGRGLHAPAGARLLAWDGAQWVEVRAEGELAFEADTFNALDFEPLTTTRLRLEIDGDGEFSTGVIEWRVLDAGGSPEFPPLVFAGPDRLVVEGGRTWLHGRVRGTGRSGVEEGTTWSKAAGPGEVTFADRAALDTTATFSRPGRYELRLEARAGELSSGDTLAVQVRPAQPIVALDPVPTGPYRLDSTFWEPRIRSLIVNWIPHCIAKCDEPDLAQGGVNNLLQAGAKLAGKPHGRHIGYPFSNAWVLNTIEAMCLSQRVDAKGNEKVLAAQAAMRDKLEEWIPILLAAQEPDGYFQTRFTLGNERDGERVPKRWSAAYRTEHEGYVAGYFLEAAIAHYRSTGGEDRRLYDAAQRLADCWDAHIGPPPKQAWYDGHQGMEIALFRFARLVDEVEGAGAGQRYAAVGKFLLDCRGTVAEGPEAHYGLGSEYHQSHLPVTQQYTAVGHAVRAVYTYAPMAEVVRWTEDVDYRSATHSLWDNLVHRKYYVTGGVGSGESAEGFGGDYSLPNNAYCESCSGAGMIFFQHRMNLAFGEGSYADLLEETLYNAVLSDIDLEGRNFTYTNALDTSQGRYDWHGCPCCVGNIPRTLLSLPTWTYATGDGSLYVNLYVGGRTTVAGVELVQETEYPWGDTVVLTVNPEQPERFALHLRLPQRSVSEIYDSSPEADGLIALRVNGKPHTTDAQNSYAVIDREWRPGDRVELRLPLAVQRVHAIEAVEADRGRVALRYGPLVFNIEEVDQDVDSLLAPDAELKAEWLPDLLGGVIAIRGEFRDGSPLLAIPNYARNNRGGRSIVWIREE